MGPAARTVLFATAPVRTGIRCIPIIATGNKTGPALSARRHPIVAAGTGRPKKSHARKIAMRRTFRFS